MNQMRVKIRIEDATAEQAAEVFRLVEDLLDKVSPVPAEGLIGQGESDGWKYSYTVTPMGGAAGAGEAPVASATVEAPPAWDARCRWLLRLPLFGRDAGARCQLARDHVGPHSYGNEVDYDTEVSHG